MLPFLKKKNYDTSSGIIIKTRTPDHMNEPESEELTELEECAKDFLEAIEAKDAKQMAKVMYDAFCLMELHPHDDYDENDDNDYTYDHDMGEE